MIDVANKTESASQVEQRNNQGNYTSLYQYKT